MKQLIDDLNWRYATKKYDPNARINSTDLAIIKDVLRLVPTSYGLQPLKYLIIEDPAVRRALLEHSSGQQAVTDASHLLVICSYRDIVDDSVDSFIENTAHTRQIELEKILGFGDFIKRTVRELTADERSTWAAKQAYIALGQLMQTCAQLRIDSTPMEGFNAAGYDQVLHLSERNLNATLVVPMGYRHPEDGNQHLKKVRRPMDELFETI